MQCERATLPDFGLDTYPSSHPPYNVAGQIQAETETGYICVLQKIIV
jgi:hypothetical protein